MSLIRNIIEKIKNKEISCAETLQKYMPAIEEGQEKYNTFISLFTERAQQRAEELDRDLESGNEAGRLMGVPVAIKDNMMLEGSQTGRFPDNLCLEDS
jgi:aspartyl-tRNA(Asn)/glutamyl-tRNA(Gln) amidotransferase subunit A